MRNQTNAGPKLDLATDTATGADLDPLAKARRRIDDRAGMNGRRHRSFKIIAA
jgi:hypothetical protein